MAKAKYVLKAIRELSVYDNDLLNKLNDIESSLDSRRFELDFLEPESEGETHDHWEEKCDELDSLIEEVQDLESQIEDIEDEDDRKEAEESLENVINMAEDYQLFYGGLARWKM